MTPERWQAVKSVLHQALERGAGERDAFVVEACAGDPAMIEEVRALIASHDDAGTFYEQPILASQEKLRFGPYETIRRLGWGGMGTVWLASRTDRQFRRLVAIKAVRPEFVDEHTLRRFENERQTLAALDHPNIVRLLDAGASEDGLPYFVMDYVEGQPLDRYAEERNLSLRERLQLFRAVCAAVHYAHQNLVVHRDLKPGNVLVTPDGTPKLLDFGIAKLLKPEYASGAIGVTRTSLQPMTPEYASPEQILGRPVTTASDVYALGVLLYGMLTGHHPFEAKTNSTLELEQAICETEPAPPSTVLARDTRRQEAAHRLRGDLDNIVLTAMRKEPQRRYLSAEHLSEDVRRYLEGLPVLARRNTIGYRTVKFVRRHAAGVAAGCAAVILLIAMAAVDHADRLRAERRFRDLRSFANFVINDLDAALREGPTPARKTVAAKAVEYLDSLAREGRGDAALQRELIAGYLKVADIQGNLFLADLGQADAARASVAKAITAAEDLARSGDTASLLQLARAYEKLGDLLATGKDRPEGVRRYQQALEIRDKLGEGAADRAAVLARMTLWSKLGYAHGEAADPMEALAAFRRCLSLGKELLTADAADRAARASIAFAEERIAYFSLLAGEPAGAEDAVREAIRVYQETAGPKPSPGARRNLAGAYKRLAEVEMKTGKIAEGLQASGESLRRIEGLLQEDPNNMQFAIDLHQNLLLRIELLRAARRDREAREETRRALRFLEPLADAPGASRHHLLNYVTLLVTTPYPDFRDDTAALDYATRAAEATGWNDREALDLLARAHDRAGDSVKAVEIERKAIALLPPARPGHRSEIRRELEENLRRFQAAASAASRSRRGYRGPEPKP